MKRKKLLGIVRHVLTFLGGAMVLSGQVDEQTAQLLSGAVITLVGGVWSILAPEKNEA